MNLSSHNATYSATAGDLRLWRIDSDRKPKTHVTLRLAQAARAAVMRVAQAQSGSPRLPESLHGPSRGETPHRHAYWLPCDLDLDGRLDHLAVHVPGGLCADGAALLDQLTGLHLDRHGPLPLMPVTTDRAIAAIAGPARLWVSAVPFIGALNQMRENGRQRPGLDALSQLRTELGRLGRPMPKVEIAPLPAPQSRIDGFLRGPRATTRRPAEPATGYFALAFSEPFNGPLAAGFGAHFGLGRFQPSTCK